jgi:signal transduction histidine kinase
LHVQVVMSKLFRSFPRAASISMIRLQLSIAGDHAEAARLRDVLAKEGFAIEDHGHTEPGVYTIVAHPSREIGPDSQQLEELEVALRELRNLDIAKSQFLANVSHELRTPLTAIVTYGEVLRDGLLGDLTDRQREAVQSVISSSRQLLIMIEEILTYAKTGARAIELFPSEFPVISVIDTVHDMSASLIRKKGIRFESAVQRDLPFARADRDKLVHVLTNLVGNAIEFTPQEDGFIRVTAKRWERDPTWICISVEDNGIGIDVEHHEMIFREFAQVDSSRARQHHGTGLGLAIAKNFIGLHGGEIGVQSEVGRGSLFYFTIPSVEAKTQ